MKCLTPSPRGAAHLSSQGPREARAAGASAGLVRSGDGARADASPHSTPEKRRRRPTHGYSTPSTWPMKNRRARAAAAACDRLPRRVARMTLARVAPACGVTADQDLSPVAGYRSVAWGRARRPAVANGLNWLQGRRPIAPGTTVAVRSPALGALQ